jgi:hypothetical protein
MDLGRTIIQQRSPLHTPQRARVGRKQTAVLCVFFYKASGFVKEIAMRRLAPVLLPIVVTIGLLIVAYVFPLARMATLAITLAALIVATVIAAVFTKETAIARSLIATLIWSLVLFELVLQ